MTTLIILIVIIAVGVKLLNSWDFGMLGGLMAVFGSILLLIHLLCWGFVSYYDYNQFKTQRNAFEQTLKSARANGNQYETAAIVKEVAEWNIKLASKKYDNTIWVFGQYIDDRIDSLNPIR
jgi:hypothetical protein